MSFEELLQKLQQDYVASLPEKVSNIERLRSQTDVPSLREAFHKLKGTGQTYGVPEVSQLAEVVEQVCVKLPEQAVTAAGYASQLLQEIHACRSRAAVFDLQADTRFGVVRDLLNH